MKKCFLLLAMLGFTMTHLIAASRADAAEATSLSGKVTAVTLYRGQALVTRELQITGAAGALEVTVSDLPMTVMNDSLYAEAPGAVEVRSLRFRRRAIGEEPREEVRKLDETIRQLQKEIELNRKLFELTSQKQSYLNQLNSFVAPTASSELTHGVLNAETLKQLTMFSFEQREAIAKEQTSLDTEHQKLNSELDLQQRSRSLVSTKSQRTIYEAVLFLEKLDDQPQTVQLNYIVQNCGWSPAYTARATDQMKSIQLEYNAIIHQDSGEDWSAVQLNLSTASPALSASGPSLAPFTVSLNPINANNAPSQVHEDQVQEDQVSQQAMQYGRNRAQQQEFNVQLNNTIDFRSKTNYNWSLNQIARDNQNIELANSKDTLSSILQEIDGAESPSMSYRIANAVSLASRSDQQLVRIFRGALASNFYHVATPLLSSYVFREAEVSNTAEIDFLAGPITVYIDDRFVGRAEIPSVAQGETFVLGLGSDAQLRARRELAEKSEGIQGGNKEIKMQYRITIENFKQIPINVRLVDRIPYSNRATDIRISLTKPSVPLSNDPTYLKREFPKNILRWDVEVPAASSGEKSYEVTYGYTLDFDRNFGMVDTTNNPSEIQEFEKLERIRQKR